MLTESLLKRCEDFEKKMTDYGIKGQSIAKIFGSDVFKEDIWDFYSIEKWFPTEKGKMRFKHKNEEILDSSDIVKCGKLFDEDDEEPRRRKKRKKRRVKNVEAILPRLKNPPDIVRERMVDKEKKPPERWIRGIVDVLDGLTVGGKQSGLKENAKNEDHNLVLSTLKS
jgi:hypothetical protein